MEEIIFILVIAAILLYVVSSMPWWVWLVLGLIALVVAIGVVRGGGGRRGGLGDFDDWGGDD